MKQQFLIGKNRVAFALLFTCMLIIFLFQNCGPGFKPSNEFLVQSLGPLPSPSPSTSPIPTPTPPCDKRDILAMAGVFQSNMVLHDSYPRLWGRARPNTRVDVELDGRANSLVSVQSNSVGDWLATIPLARIQPGITKIIVKNNCETKEVFDVKIGEVWLCSGQSNMRIAVRASSSVAEVLAQVATDDIKNNIRIFSVATGTSATPYSEFPSQAEEPMAYKWLTPTTTTITDFSAVCYHFGRALQAKINKPVGLIHSSFDASPIQAWLPYDYLPVKDRISDATNVALNSSVLYNAMISALTPMKISGVAWYQGESNISYSKRYANLLIQLFKSWRAKFDTSFPIYVVQLANYSTEQVVAPNQVVPPAESQSLWALLRHAQQLATESDRGIWMVPLLDGATRDEANAAQIHPKNKKLVGERLARSTIANTYLVGKDPLPAWQYAATTSNGASVLLKARFNQGVTPPAVGKTFAGFVLKGATGNYFYADRAVVTGVNAATGIATIEVRATAVTDPVEVRFQFAQHPIVSFKTTEFGDPLPPLCLVKTNGTWILCNYSEAPGP